MASCGMIKSSFLSLQKFHENPTWFLSNITNLPRQKVSSINTLILSVFIDLRTIIFVSWTYISISSFQFSCVAASHQENPSTSNDLIVRIENGKLARKLNFSGEQPLTPILDTINYPAHMKNLSLEVN